MASSAVTSPFRSALYQPAELPGSPLRGLFWRIQCIAIEATRLQAQRDRAGWRLGTSGLGCYDETAPDREGNTQRRGELAAEGLRERERPLVH